MGPRSLRERAILGSYPAQWKALGVSNVVYTAKGIMLYSITTWQPTAMIPIVRCHITLSLWNICSLRCGLSSKFFDHLFVCVWLFWLSAHVKTRFRNNSQGLITWFVFWIYFWFFSLFYVCVCIFVSFLCLYLFSFYLYSVYDFNNK